jgi:hypothetical protein
LERGNATGASDQVLDALADALRLDDAERTHLFDLAHGASSITPQRRRTGSASQRVRPAVHRILDSIDAPAPAVRNQRALDRYFKAKKSKWQVGRDYERYVVYLNEARGFTVNYYGIEKGLEDLGRDVIA